MPVSMTVRAPVDGLTAGRCAHAQNDDGQMPLSPGGVSINARSPFDGLRVSGKSSMKSGRGPLVLSSSKHERGENRQSPKEGVGGRSIGADAGFNLP